MKKHCVGETVCPVEHEDALPLLRIDEPTLQMTFLVNNSPFAGREGKYITSRKIEERLRSQLETDVSLREIIQSLLMRGSYLDVGNYIYLS